MAGPPRGSCGAALLAALLAAGSAWGAGLPPRLDLDGDGRADLIVKGQAPNPPYDHYIAARTSLGAWATLWSWPVNGSAGRALVTARDFTGDGKGDILWALNGQFELWVMNGVAVRRQVPLPPSGAGWDLRGAGDFDADQRADILWQDGQNGLHMWLFRRPGFVESLDLGVLQLPWRVAAVADFNGDGRADILLRNLSSGALYEWQMNGPAITAHGPLSMTLDLAWSLAASGDFNGDGRADLLWSSLDATRVWNVSGFQVLAAFGEPSLAPEAVDAFNGDGRAQVLQIIGVAPTPGPGCDLALTQYVTLDPGGPPAGGATPPNICVGSTYVQPGMF